MTEHEKKIKLSRYKSCLLKLFKLLLVCVLVCFSGERKYNSNRTSVHKRQQQEHWVRLDGLLPFRHRLITVRCLQPPTDAIQKWHTWPAARAITISTNKATPGRCYFEGIGLFRAPSKLFQLTIRRQTAKHHKLTE